MTELEAAEAAFNAAELELEAVRLKYWQALSQFRVLREAVAEARAQREHALARWQAVSRKVGA